MRGTLPGIVSLPRSLGRALLTTLLTAGLSSASLAQSPARRRPSPSPPQPPGAAQASPSARQEALCQDTRSQVGRGASSTQPAAGLDRRGAAEDESADLSITARVTADSLCFERVPNPRVEFAGRPERSTVWEAERENLPQEVRPGVTYRDIGITLRITSVFADIDRIVAEALGEVPADADAPADATRPVPAPPAQPSNSDNARPPSTPGAASRTPAPSTPAAQTPADPGTAAPRRGLARRGRTR